MLQAGKRIISIDESSVTETNNKNYTWVKKGENQRHCYKQGFSNITVIGAITMSGSIYYSLVKGSNTAVTYAIFLEELSDRLDQDEPGWRRTSIMIQDNAALHQGPAVLKAIRDNHLPMWNSAPASFSCLVIELWWAKMKERFRKIYEEEQDKWLAGRDNHQRGEKMKMVLRSLEMAMSQVSQLTTKKCFPYMLA